ncbi:MAG: hypothetical protein V1676_00170 [Candidatus Diapherotrites archaeon]
MAKKARSNAPKGRALTDGADGDFGEGFFLVLAVLLIAAAAVFIYSLSLGRAPEEFTQAWLEGTPEKVIVGRPFAVNFVVANSTGSAEDYKYAITAEGMPKVQGFIPLAPMRREKVSNEISLGTPGMQKVQIDIAPQNSPEAQKQTLWFWVEAE